MKIGRNNPCPCGSGKKYKHCHGKMNVISVEQVLLEELEQIKMRIFEFAIERYPVFLQMRFNHFLQDVDDVYVPEEMFEVVSLYYFISFEPLDTGKTILETFVTREAKKIQRQRTRSIVQSWDLPVPVFGISWKKAERKFVIEDLLSGRAFTVHSKIPLTDGKIQLQLLLPYMNGDYVLLYPATEIPPEHIDGLIKRCKNEIQEAYNDSYENFLRERFLFVLNDIFRSIEEEDDDDDGIAALPVDDLLELINFEKEIYEEIVYMLLDELVFFDVNEDLLKIIVLFWADYAEEEGPIIRKPEIYVAALLYCFQEIGLIPTAYTHKELAEKFTVSAASISRVAENLLKYLAANMLDLSLDNLQYRHLEEPRMVERDTWEISVRMEQMEIETEDDINTVFKEFNEGTISVIPQTDKERAQALLYDAFEKSGFEKLELAKEALEIYPFSPDAYTILAEFAEDIELAVTFLEKGVQVGKEDLHELLANPNGELWLHVEARPFLRAKKNLAMLLEQVGLDMQAMKHYEELLELNKNDNQGVRYLLLSLYIRKHMYQKARQLIREYGDSSTFFIFSKFFIELSENGISKKAKAYWKNARDSNRFLAEFLLADEMIPQARPDYYRPGSEEEALLFYDDFKTILIENHTLNERFHDFTKTL